MNSYIFQTDPCSKSSFDGIQVYTFQNPRQQNFTFCYTFIKYIFTNPTPKAWKKLIKTCKYFFPKYPVYPISSSHLRRGGEWSGDGGTIYSNRNLVKLWLHDSLSVNTCNISSTELSSIIPKLAKCDLRDVWIYNQNLTFEEYQFFTSSSTIELLYFGEICTIKYSDNSFVTFDKLLKNHPNIKTFIHFNVNPSMFEPDTVKKMVEILRQFKKLECLKLFYLVETFDISSITDYLLENQTAEIVLYFIGGFSDAFKLELNKCFQKIVKNPPKILTKTMYPGMDEIQFEEYKKLYQ